MPAGRSYGNKPPAQVRWDCSNGKTCLKLTLEFRLQLTDVMEDLQRKYGLQKAAAVAGWCNESASGPSAAYIRGGRGCLVLMGDSYNANIDKKKPPDCTGGLVGVTVLTNYNARNIPWPAPATLPAQTPGTSLQQAPAGRRSGTKPPGPPARTPPRAPSPLSSCGQPDRSGTSLPGPSLCSPQHSIPASAY